MKIEELVKMDVEGEFRSDVQLSDFENPIFNLQLLRNYIFTIHAPTTLGFAQRDYSAKGVLDLLKTAFTVERFENRFVLTANYGRGKSHLALTLANFFSRPTNSKEVEIVLSRFGQALNNPSQLAGYREFKNSKGEFLVIRLQGDSINDLQEGFVLALEQALSEHDATVGLEIPLWTHTAANWLRGLEGQIRQRAEEFLSQENTDLASLVESLKQEGARELTLELFKHLNGVYPNFGREINLKDLIVWVVDEVCKPKGFGGLLILFDEFSLFLHKYVESRSIGKLQELLNGISYRPGKSVFLAFSQQDVDTVAETYAQGQRREDVKKELERLPKDKRGRLFSLMESVLDAYLKQDEAAWDEFQSQQSVRSALAQAREIVLEYFSKHYFDELHWDVDSFGTKVIKGCFPLHPLTTAFLSIHQFEAGASENPRTALQFVRESWSRIRKQEAELLDGQPNFVYPIALADFFGEQLSKKWYAAYQNALQTAPQALGVEQQKVLRALFIQTAVNLKAQAGAQIELLHHLSGLERDTIKRVLKEMAAVKIIHSDPVNKVSSLWPASTRPQEVEEILQNALEKTPVDQALMAHIVSAFARAPMELTLQFGNTSDWAPYQVAMTAEMFNAQELRKLIQPYRIGVSNIEEGKRGLVVWLIAQTEQEKNSLRQIAQATLDKALTNTTSPLPIVIVCPKRPVPGLVTVARRVKALENLDRTNREKIGSMMYTQEQGLTQASFLSAVSDLVGDIHNYAELPHSLLEYAIPSVYLPSVQALKNLSLKSILTDCYRQAYAYRVDFYTQYTVSGKGPNQLRNAVQNVVRGLFIDEIAGSLPTLKNKDIQFQLITYYLTQRWGLLAPQNYAIQPPTIIALQQAWDILNQAFPPGCNEVRVQDVLIQLLNPPYGHDYNTLVLLLAAWIGYHRHEISRFSLNGQIVSLNQFKGLFNESKSLQEFFTRIFILSPLALSRAKPDEMYRQADTILEPIRQGKLFSVAKARQALILLEQTLNRPRLSDSKREEIEQLHPRLEEALIKANDYDQQVAKWVTELEKSDFDDLLRLHERLKEIPFTSFVQPEQPSIPELQNRWEKALQSALRDFCSKHSKLDDLADYKSQEERLKRARKSLDDYPAFAQKVDEALKALTRHREELKQRESEKSIVEAITNMAPSASLAVLYEYRARLTKFKNLTPQTEALRAEKISQVETKIGQYEQVAQLLPAAIAKAKALPELRHQRDLLLRNLTALQGTSHETVLLESQQKIEQLDAFFESLQNLDHLPSHTPDDLESIESQLEDMERLFSSWLSPVQQDLLKSKRKEISQLRQRKISEAHAWLEELARRYKNSEMPTNLLKMLETPPAFLSGEDLSRISQLKQTLHRKIEDDLVAQIEERFIRITDIATRRRCLERLQQLME